MELPRIGDTTENGIQIMTTVEDRARLLVEAGLFDEAWYVERYPDVLKSRLRPAEHYVRIGQHLGRKATGGDAVEAVEAASRFIEACRSDGEDQVDLGEGLRDRIAALRLFDAEWYRSHFAQQLDPSADALHDYLRRSASDPRIDPSPLFSTCYYVEKNSDTSSMAPLLHASSYGIDEGRPAFDPNKVNEFLEQSKATSCTELADILDVMQPVQIVYWEKGNFFFQEIAEYLSVYLSDGGYRVSCGPDLAKSGTAGENVVVVAPHEFCVHGPGKAWDEQQLRSAVYLNTEQWHTGWFSLAYKFLVMSDKAVDMNPASASGLQSLGIRTAFLPILPLPGSPFAPPSGPVPLSEDFASARYIRQLTYPSVLDERPYDVLFVGAANPRREAALASLAPVLGEHEAFIHCPRFDGPVRQGDPDMMSTSDLVQIARNSKILLNIHQGASRYFEWHRLFLFGIMEGCVVLTEPCIPNQYVQGGEHFLECELGDMRERLSWLLQTREGKAEMRRIRANCDRLRENGADWMRIAA